MTPIIKMLLGVVRTRFIFAFKLCVQNLQKYSTMLIFHSKKIGDREKNTEQYRARISKIFETSKKKAYR